MCLPDRLNSVYKYNIIKNPVANVFEMVYPPHASREQKQIWFDFFVGLYE